MSDPTSEQELRVEVVRFCKLLHQKNFLAANDGNVSVRLSGEEVLITPTGVPKAFLAPEDLVVVNLKGELVRGRGTPSGELAMHLRTLEARPDAKAVVHAHPPTCIALTLLKHLRLNGVLPEVILSIGKVEVVPYRRPLTDELAEAVADVARQTDALILERHGTVTVGSSVAEAYSRTERIEHAAQVLWLAHAIGRPAPLPEGESRALLNIYAATRAQTD